MRYRHSEPGLWSFKKKKKKEHTHIRGLNTEFFPVLYFRVLRLTIKIRVFISALRKYGTANMQRRMQSLNYDQGS